MKTEPQIEAEIDNARRALAKTSNRGVMAAQSAKITALMWVLDRPDPFDEEAEVPCDEKGCEDGHRVVNPVWPKGESPYRERCPKCGGRGVIAANEVGP